MWTLLVLCSVIASHGVQGDDDFLTTIPSESALYTVQTSCRGYCGQTLLSCSCSSHCQNQGNCCYDYSYYCQYATSQIIRSTTAVPPPIWTSTSPACGGSLFGSGTFSSPYHPNHYPDHSYCIWQLRAANDQRIFLTFTYLELENCCSCDFIQVFNGPSINSQYLGKVCNDSLTSFHSTSNYMTVLFRTDGSVVGRGFSANFLSSLQPSSGQVDCSSNRMNIVIKRSYLNSIGFGGHTLYVDDPNCRPEVSAHEVVFNFPISFCGSVQKYENGRAVYTNSVRGYSSSSSSEEITRQSHFKLNVSCQMEQDAVSQIMYIVESNVNSSLTGTGTLNASVTFYTSSSFHYAVTESPYKVSLNQMLYVQLSLFYNTNLVIFIDTCAASRSQNDFQTRPYYLIRNGCPQDSTYYTYLSGTRAFARFRFRAFQFLRATDSVYIQCKVAICRVNDNDPRCRRSCTRRATRDLGSEHDTQTLVLGPIQLKEPEKKEENHEQDKA